MGKTVVDDSRLSSIASGVEIVGDIVANGNFRIEGTIKGNIKLSGRLVLDGTGIIEGDVVCNSARISGKMDGKLKVESLLELTDTANVHGQIITAKMKVDEGAIFTGTCDMDSKSTSQPNPEKK